MPIAALAPALLAAAPSLLQAGASVISAFQQQQAPKAVQAPTVTTVGYSQPLPGFETGRGLQYALQAGQTPTISTAGVRGFMPSGVKRSYSVQRDKGRIVDLSTGRTIGYTPREAKKRYKTRRRRKRLSKRDIYILETLKQAPGASAALAML